MNRISALAPIAALLSGSLLALCYAPWNLDGFVWIWAIPLLASLWLLPDSDQTGWRKSRAWRGFKLGYLCGIAFFGLNLHWLLELRNVIDSTFFAVLGLLSLSLYLSLYFGLFAAFAATIGRPTRQHLCPDPNQDKDSSSTPRSLAKANEKSKPRRIERLFASSYWSILIAAVNATAWVSLEWIRSWMLTGFGWNGLGVALVDNPILTQTADLIGVTGLSFLPMFCLCIAIHTVVRIHLEAGSRRLRPHLDFAAAIILVILTFFYGTNRLATPPGGKDPIEVRSLLIQPNVPQEDKWDAERASEIYRLLLDLTSPYTGGSHLDLIIWPEACLPLDYYYAEHENYFNSLLQGESATLAIGTNLALPANRLPDEDPDSFTNALALVQGDFNNATFYSKSHLVPFGEFVPLREIFPPLAALLSGVLPADFDPGTSIEPLSFAAKDGDCSIIPSICFEDTVGRLARKFIRSEPQVLLNVTNDGWFGTSALSAQHLANARFRCIELRRPMIRCANNGVSGFIDETGSLYDRVIEDDLPRIVADYESGETHVLGTRTDISRLRRNSEITLYARWGDWFAIACFILTIAAILKRYKKAA